MSGVMQGSVWMAPLGTPAPSGGSLFGHTLNQRPGVADRRLRTMLLRVERRRARRHRRHGSGWQLLGATDQGWGLRGWVDEVQQLPWERVDARPLVAMAEEAERGASSMWVGLPLPPW